MAIPNIDKLVAIPNRSFGLICDGEELCSMNWTELYNLKGRLFTLIDASFADPQQRKAFKDVTWSILGDWIGDIESECFENVNEL